LTSMIQELQFEPHAVNLKKANAWLKEHAEGSAQDKTFSRNNVKLAAYARKLGLLTDEDGE